MVAAFGPGGMTLAVDSVSWRADERWVTSPAELFPGRGTFQAAAAGAVDPVERPAVLTLGGDRPFAAQLSGGHAPGSCWLHRKTNLGLRPVSVGELHLNDSWGGTYEFTNSKTTSLQVGVSRRGQGWSAGGSVTFDRSSQLAQEQTIRPAETEATRFYRYDADMEFHRFDWKCSSGVSGYEDASTLEPTDWHGGLWQREANNPPGCDGRHYTTVVPDGHLKRIKGSSITLGGAVSLLGFSGSMTSTVAENVRYEWHNARPWHRSLCGSKDYLDLNTRVVTSG